MAASDALIQETCGSSLCLRSVRRSERVERVEAEFFQLRVGLEVFEEFENVVLGAEFVAVVDLPRHTVGRELLGHRRPGEAALEEIEVDERLDERPTVFAVRIERARHAVEPVRVGRADDRAVVVVADREVFGERPVERNVLAFVVGHRGGCGRFTVVGHVRGHEAVHLAVVPGFVLGAPGVREVREARLAGPHGAGRVVRHQDPVEPFFFPAGLFEAAFRRRRVIEAPHPGKHPEVVVERAVLLDQDHHVLDVGEFAGRQFLRHGQLQERVRGHRRHPGSGPRRQQLPTCHPRHLRPPFAPRQPSKPVGDGSPSRRIVPRADGV